jgi:hypothetical protein
MANTDYEERPNHSRARAGGWLAGSPPSLDLFTRRRPLCESGQHA